MDQIGLELVLKDAEFQQGLARYTAGVAKMQDATTRAALSMGNSMTAFSHTFSTAVGTVIGVLTTQLLPKLSSAMMAPIDATRSWGGQLDELSDIFGMADAEATGFAVAMNKVGISTDEGMAAFSYFTRQVATTQDQMKSAAETFGRAAADISESHADAMSQIAKHWAQAQADASASIAAVWEELNDKRAEIESNLSDTLADIWESLKERRAEIEENLSETLEDIWTNLKERRAEIEQDLAENIDGINKGLAERLLSIQESLNDRLSALAEQRAELYADTADAIAKVDEDLNKRLRTVRSPRERRELKKEAEERKAEIEAEARKREEAIAKQEAREIEQAEKQRALAEKTAAEQIAAARKVAAEQIAAQEKIAAKQTAAAQEAAQKQIEIAEKVAAKQAEQAEKTAAKQISAAEKAAQKQTEAIEKALAKQAQAMKEQQEEVDKQAEKALAKAKQALGQAQTQSPFAKALAELGLTLDDVTNKSVPFIDRLGLMMDAFAKLPAGADASAIIQQLFGKSGLKWLDFFRMGKEGLEQAKKLGIDLGIVLDPDKIKQYNQSLSMFNLMWDAIGINLGKVILPIAQELLTAFNKFMTSDAIPNLSKLMDRLATAFKGGMEKGGLIGGLEALGKEFWTALTEPKGIFEQLGAFIGRIRDWFEKGEGKIILTKVGETFSAIIGGFTAWAGGKEGTASITGVTQAIGDAMMAGIRLVFGAAEQVAGVMQALSDSMLLWVNSPAGQKSITDLTQAVANAVFAGIQLVFARNDKGDFVLSSLASNLFWSVYRTIENITKIGTGIATSIINGIVSYFFGEQAGKAFSNSLAASLGNTIMALCAPGMFFANLGAQIANALYTGLTKGWGELLGGFNPFGNSTPQGDVKPARSFDLGGWVRQTGPAIVHAGEYVLNPSQARVMAPLLSSSNDSRTYNFSFSNTWNGNAGAIERSEIEALVRQTTFGAFRQVIRGA